MTQNGRDKKKFDRRIILEILAEHGEIFLENLLNQCLSMPAFFLRKHSISEAIAPPKRVVRIDFSTKIRFSNLISKLNKDGLIEKTSKSLKISSAGITHLKKHPSTSVRYEAEWNVAPGQITLVIFDIPEKLRQWREWLRFELKDLGFLFLQNSVWYGTHKVPVEFIKDLEKYRLLPYIHILSVNKQGTLSGWFKQIGKRGIAD